MAEVQHIVSVTAHFERERDDYLLKAPTTYAIIEVKPPIDPGEEFTFKRAILGHEWCLVDLRKLFATGSAIVFMAESSIPDQDQRHEDIAVIARRLGELANNPQAALKMMEDMPFPEQKHEPKLEAVKDLPLEDEEVKTDSLPEDDKASGFTVHLAPVEIPSLEVNIPPAPNLGDRNVKPPETLPPVELPEPLDTDQPQQPSAFGPQRAGLTGFAPTLRVLPWPPQASEGKHASKDQTEN